MIIKNGLVFDEKKHFVKKDLFIENGKIVSSVSNPVAHKVINAEGLFVIPGLIDIHSHGACGHDFCDASAQGLEEILSYEYAHGITSYCPTTMTIEKNQLFTVFETAVNRKPSKNCADIVGFHMEGPFIDPQKKGAQKASCILEPDISFFRECNTIARHQIRLITLAPNMPGAIPFIKALHDTVNISLGHCYADYDTAVKAFQAGANHVTHLFNAMNPFLHRDPGIIGAAFDCKHCMIELICDGIHVHESMIRAAFSLFPDRIVLISDSMEATGLDDGMYQLGGQKVHVCGKVATLEDNTIAGSVTNLFDCMLHAISIGIEPCEAIAAATINPAKSIGIYDKVGSLTPGKKADLLLLDKNYQLIQVLS